MNKKSDPGKRPGLRFTALVTVFVFTLTSVSWNTPAEAAPLEATSVAMVLSPSAIVIPSEMGTVTKVSLPTEDQRPQTADQSLKGHNENLRGRIAKSLRSPVSSLQSPAGEGRMVVLIQDAHAVMDAQENISKILGHLQKNYGLNLAALEGAKGRLEPILLRTFPEPQVKRKILAGYEKRAELSGPEMAAVFQETPGEFRGMEEWSLYKKNYFAYLRAQEKKGALLSRWNALKQSLDSERAKVYDAKLNEFEEVRENFLTERASLLDLLVYLANFKGLFADRHPEGQGTEGSRSGILRARLPGGSGAQNDGSEGYQELPGLIESIGYEKSGKQDALVPLVRKISDEFKVKYLRGLGVKTEMNFYNRYQAFMTGQITAGQMLQYLFQVGRENGKAMKLTPALKKLLGHAELLSEIKGSRIYDELQRFMPEVEASLIKTPEQRKLADQYQKLFLMKEMITLELTHEDLAKYKKEPDAYLAPYRDPVSAGSSRTFEDDLAPALEFYEAALERDHAFYKNIDALMQKQTRDQRPATIVVVAGGFHTNGLERILKDKGVAYAVVAPKIASLEGIENYAKVMKGDVSFKSYLKTTYFDALMRAASKALVEALPLPDRVRALKTWRDNVIRELAKEGRITDAGKYLPYIDEILQSMPEAATAIGPKRTKQEILDIVRKELEKFKTDSLARIWKTFEYQVNVLTDGLKDLVTKKELTTDKVSELITRASQSKPSLLNSVQALDESISRLSTATSVDEAAIREAVRNVAGPTRQILDTLRSRGGTAGPISLTPDAVEAASQLITQGNRFPPEVESVEPKALGESLSEVARSALPNIEPATAERTIAEAMTAQLPGNIAGPQGNPVSVTSSAELSVQEPLREINVVSVPADFGQRMNYDGEKALWIDGKPAEYLGGHGQARVFRLEIQGTVVALRIDFHRSYSLEAHQVFSNIFSRLSGERISPGPRGIGQTKNGYNFLAVEYVKGYPLPSKRPLNENELAYLFALIDRMAANREVWRDVTPQQFMIGATASVPEEQAWLLDPDGMYEQYTGSDIWKKIYWALLMYHSDFWKKADPENKILRYVERKVLLEWIQKQTRPFFTPQEFADFMAGEDYQILPEDISEDFSALVNEGSIRHENGGQYSQVITHPSNPDMRQPRAETRQEVRSENRGVTPDSKVGGRAETQLENQGMTPIEQEAVSDANIPSYAKQAFNALRSFVRPLTRVVSVGSGIPMSLQGNASKHEPTELIPWEELCLRLGGNVSVFEPQEITNKQWRNAVVQWEALPGHLSVIPSDAALFEKNVLEDGSVGLVILSSVLSAPTISADMRKEISRQVARVLKDQGYVLISWYTYNEYSSESLRVIMEKNEHARMLEGLGVIRDSGCELGDPIARGAEQGRGGHYWELYKIKKSSKNDRAETRQAARSENQGVTPDSKVGDRAETRTVRSESRVEEAVKRLEEIRRGSPSSPPSIDGDLLSYDEIEKGILTGSIELEENGNLRFNDDIRRTRLPDYWYHGTGHTRDAARKLIFGEFPGDPKAGYLAKGDLAPGIGRDYAASYARKKDDLLLEFDFSKDRLEALKYLDNSAAVAGSSAGRIRPIPLTRLSLESKRDVMSKITPMDGTEIRKIATGLGLPESEVNLFYQQRAAEPQKVPGRRSENLDPAEIVNNILRARQEEEGQPVFLGDMEEAEEVLGKLEEYYESREGEDPPEYLIKKMLRVEKMDGVVMVLLTGEDLDFAEEWQGPWMRWDEYKEGLIEENESIGNLRELLSGTSRVLQIKGKGEGEEATRWLFECLDPLPSYWLEAETDQYGVKEKDNGIGWMVWISWNAERGIYEIKRLPLLERSEVRSVTPDSIIRPETHAETGRETGGRGPETKPNRAEMRATELPRVELYKYGTDEYNGVLGALSGDAPDISGIAKYLVGHKNLEMIAVYHRKELLGFLTFRENQRENAVEQMLIYTFMKHRSRNVGMAAIVAFLMEAQKRSKDHSWNQVITTKLTSSGEKLWNYVFQQYLPDWSRNGIVQDPEGENIVRLPKSAIEGLPLTMPEILSEPNKAMIRKERDAVAKEGGIKTIGDLRAVSEEIVRYGYENDKERENDEKLLKKAGVGFFMDDLMKQLEEAKKRFRKVFADLKDADKKATVYVIEKMSSVFFAYRGEGESDAETIEALRKDLQDNFPRMIRNGTLILHELAYLYARSRRPERGEELVSIIEKEIPPGVEEVLFIESKIRSGGREYFRIVDMQGNLIYLAAAKDLASDLGNLTGYNDFEVGPVAEIKRRMMEGKVALYEYANVEDRTSRVQDSDYVLYVENGQLKRVALPVDLRSEIRRKEKLENSANRGVTPDSDSARSEMRSKTQKGAEWLETPEYSNWKRFFRMREGDDPQKNPYHLKMTPEEWGETLKLVKAIRYLSRKMAGIGIEGFEDAAIDVFEALAGNEWEEDAPGFEGKRSFFGPDRPYHPLDKDFPEFEEDAYSYGEDTDFLRWKTLSAFLLEWFYEPFWAHEYDPADKPETELGLRLGELREITRRFRANLDTGRFKRERYFDVFTYEFSLNSLRLKTLIEAFRGENDIKIDDEGRFSYTHPKKHLYDDATLKFTNYWEDRSEDLESDWFGLPRDPLPDRNKFFAAWKNAQDGDWVLVLDPEHFQSYSSEREFSESLIPRGAKKVFVETVSDAFKKISQALASNKGRPCIILSRGTHLKDSRFVTDLWSYLSKLPSAPKILLLEEAKNLQKGFKPEQPRKPDGMDLQEWQDNPYIQRETWIKFEIRQAVSSAKSELRAETRQESRRQTPGPGPETNRRAEVSATKSSADRRSESREWTWQRYLKILHGFEDFDSRNIKDILDAGKEPVIGFNDAGEVIAVDEKDALLPSPYLSSASLAVSLSKLPDGRIHEYPVTIFGDRKLLPRGFLSAIGSYNQDILSRANRQVAPFQSLFERIAQPFDRDKDLIEKGLIKQEWIGVKVDKYELAERILSLKGFEWLSDVLKNTEGYSRKDFEEDAWRTANYLRQTKQVPDHRLAWEVFLSMAADEAGNSLIIGFDTAGDPFTLFDAFRRGTAPDGIFYKLLKDPDLKDWLPAVADYGLSLSSGLQAVYPSLIRGGYDDQKIFTVVRDALRDNKSELERKIISCGMLLFREFPGRSENRGVTPISQGTKKRSEDRSDSAVMPVSGEKVDVLHLDTYYPTADPRHSRHLFSRAMKVYAKYKDKEISKRVAQKYGDVLNGLLDWSTVDEMLLMPSSSPENMPLQLFAEQVKESLGPAARFKISNAFKRQSAVVSQKEVVGNDARRANVAGTFSLDPAFVSRLKGKTVVLFDDNYTSGASVQEALRVLEAAGAKKIVVLVAGRTVSGDSVASITNPILLRDLFLNKPKPGVIGQDAQSAERGKLILDIMSYFLDRDWQRLLDPDEMSLLQVLERDDLLPSQEIQGIEELLMKVKTRAETRRSEWPDGQARSENRGVTPVSDSARSEMRKGKAQKEAAILDMVTLDSDASFQVRWLLEEFPMNGWKEGTTVKVRIFYDPDYRRNGSHGILQLIFDDDGPGFDEKTIADFKLSADALLKELRTEDNLLRYVVMTSNEKGQLTGEEYLQQNIQLLEDFSDHPSFETLVHMLCNRDAAIPISTKPAQDGLASVGGRGFALSQHYVQRIKGDMQILRGPEGRGLSVRISYPLKETVSGKKLTELLEEKQARLVQYAESKGKKLVWETGVRPFRSESSDLGQPGTQRSEVRLGNRGVTAISTVSRLFHSLRVILLTAVATVVPLLILFYTAGWQWLAWIVVSLSVIYFSLNFLARSVKAMSSSKAKLKADLGHERFKDFLVGFFISSVPAAASMIMVFVGYDLTPAVLVMSAVISMAVLVRITAGILSRIYRVGVRLNWKLQSKRKAALAEKFHQTVHGAAGHFIGGMLMPMMAFVISWGAAIASLAKAAPREINKALSLKLPESPFTKPAEKDSGEEELTVVTVVREAAKAADEILSEKPDIPRNQPDPFDQRQPLAPTLQTAQPVKEDPLLEINREINLKAPFKDRYTRLAEMINAVEEFVDSAESAQYRADVKKLMMRIILVESDLIRANGQYGKDADGGPGAGYPSIEVKWRKGSGTAEYCLKEAWTNPKYKHLRPMVVRLFGLSNRNKKQQDQILNNFYSDPKGFKKFLGKNPLAAVFLARVKLLTSGKRVPPSSDSMAQIMYWIRYYWGGSKALYENRMNHALKMHAETRRLARDPNAAMIFDAEEIVKGDSDEAKIKRMLQLEDHIKNAVFDIMFEALRKKNMRSEIREGEPGMEKGKLTAGNRSETRKDAEDETTIETGESPNAETVFQDIVKALVRGYRIGGGDFKRPREIRAVRVTYVPEADKFGPAGLRIEEERVIGIASSGVKTLTKSIALPKGSLDQIRELAARQLPVPSPTGFEFPQYRIDMAEDPVANTLIFTKTPVFPLGAMIQYLIDHGEIQRTDRLDEFLRTGEMSDLASDSKKPAILKISARDAVLKFLSNCLKAAPEHMNPETEKDIVENLTKFFRFLLNINGKVGQASFGSCLSSLRPRLVDTPSEGTQNRNIEQAYRLWRSLVKIGQNKEDDEATPAEKRWVTNLKTWTILDPEGNISPNFSIRSEVRVPESQVPNPSGAVAPVGFDEQRVQRVVKEISDRLINPFTGNDNPSDYFSWRSPYMRSDSGHEGEINVVRLQKEIRELPIDRLNGADVAESLRRLLFLNPARPEDGAIAKGWLRQFQNLHGMSKGLIELIEEKTKSHQPVRFLDIGGGAFPYLGLVLKKYFKDRIDVSVIDAAAPLAGIDLNKAGVRYMEADAVEVLNRMASSNRSLEPSSGRVPELFDLIFCTRAMRWIELKTTEGGETIAYRAMQLLADNGFASLMYVPKKAGKEAFPSLPDKEGYDFERKYGDYFGDRDLARNFNPQVHAAKSRNWGDDQRSDGDQNPLDMGRIRTQIFAISKRAKIRDQGEPGTQRAEVREQGDANMLASRPSAKVVSARPAQGRSEMRDDKDGTPDRGDGTQGESGYDGGEYVYTSGPQNLNATPEEIREGKKSVSLYGELMLNHPGLTFETIDGVRYLEVYRAVGDSIPVSELAKTAHLSGAGLTYEKTKNPKYSRENAFLDYEKPTAAEAVLDSLMFMHSGNDIALHTTVLASRVGEIFGGIEEMNVITYRIPVDWIIQQENRPSVFTEAELESELSFYYGLPKEFVSTIEPITEFCKRKGVRLVSADEQDIDFWAVMRDGLRGPSVDGEDRAKGRSEMRGIIKPLSENDFKTINALMRGGSGDENREAFLNAETAGFVYTTADIAKLAEDILGTSLLPSSEPGSTVPGYFAALIANKDGAPATEADRLSVVLSELQSNAMEHAVEAVEAKLAQTGQKTPEPGSPEYPKYLTSKVSRFLGRTFIWEGRKGIEILVANNGLTDLPSDAMGKSSTGDPRRGLGLALVRDIAIDGGLGFMEIYTKSYKKIYDPEHPDGQEIQYGPDEVPPFQGKTLIRVVRFLPRSETRGQPERRSENRTDEMRPMTREGMNKFAARNAAELERFGIQLFPLSDGWLGFSFKNAKNDEGATWGFELTDLWGIALSKEGKETFLAVARKNSAGQIEYLRIPTDIAGNDFSPKRTQDYLTQWRIGENDPEGIRGAQAFLLYDELLNRESSYEGEIGDQVKTYREKYSGDPEPLRGGAKGLIEMGHLKNLSPEIIGFFVRYGIFDKSKQHNILKALEGFLESKGRSESRDKGQMDVQAVQEAQPQLQPAAHYAPRATTLVSEETAPAAVQGRSELRDVQRFFDQAKAIDSNFKGVLSFSFELLFRTIVTSEVLRPHWEKLMKDEYHGFEHALTVVNIAMDLAQKEARSGQPVDFDVVVLGAFFHDLYAPIQRKKHEEEGALLARKVLEEAGIAMGVGKMDAIGVVVKNHGKDAHQFGDLPEESKIVRDADTIIEAIDLDRIAEVSVVNFKRAFYNEKILSKRRLQVLATEDREVVEAPENDALMFLLRNVTKDVDPGHYVTEAAKAYIRETNISGKNKNKLLELTAHYDPANLGAIEAVVDAVTQAYWNRSESRVNFGGLVTVSREEVMSVTAKNGPEAVREKLLGGGRSELRAVEMRMDAGVTKTLSDLLASDNPVAVIVAPGYAAELKENLQGAGLEAMDLDIGKLYQRLCGEVLAPVTLEGEGFLDFGKELDRKRIDKVLGILQKAEIANENTPRVVLLMRRPNENFDAEAFLSLIGDLPIEQLIVFSLQGQSLGASWMKAAKGRLTPIKGRSEQDLSRKAARVAKAQDRTSAMVALSSGKDLGVGAFGRILSLLVEAGKLADPDLRNIVFKSIELMVRKYASASAEDREKMLMKPELLLVDLNKLTGLDLRLLRVKGGTFSLDLRSLVASFVSQKSIDQAA